jgi:hypothetical protein
MVLYELEELLPKALANLQFWSGQHLTLFLHDWQGDIPSRRLGHGKQHDSALQTCRL